MLADMIPYKSSQAQFVFSAIGVVLITIAIGTKTEILISAGASFLVLGAFAFVRSVFSATDINFVGFYGLFTGFYFGIAISTAAETVIYLVSKWFRTGFGEFLKALVSFTVCQYVLSTAVEGLTGVNHTVQTVFKVLMIIGLFVIAIQMISIIVRGVVKEVKANI